jgi:Flp pilus assembly CpaF family ATPase
MGEPLPAAWLPPAFAPAPEEPAAADPSLVREVRAQVVDELADHLARTPVQDPIQRRELARSLLARVLAERSRKHLAVGREPLTEMQEFAVASAVMAALFGLGRLQPLIDDPDVENIEINGADQVWVCYADGRQQQVAPVADSDSELVELLQGLAARTGNAERTFTTASPSLHLRLDDGSRLAAMAWTTPRPAVVIRRHRVRRVDLAGLVRLGMVDTTLAAFLRAALRAGRNIVVTGLQNVGKTTLVRAIAEEFEPQERFATIEREYELHLHEHRPRVVALQAREGSSERDATGRGAGEVGVGDLLVDALRMNLRRIIVGEVRGDEAIPMLHAMSTGDGSLCTLHARSASHALERLVTLCLSAGGGMTADFAYRLAAGSIDLVVHVTMRTNKSGTARFVSEVIEVDGIGEAGRPALTRVFTAGPGGRAVPGHPPRCLPTLIDAGFDPALLEDPYGTWNPSLLGATP